MTEPNRIKRHIPGFVEHDAEDKVEVDFHTVDELLNIEWVKRWTNKQFCRFSVARGRIFDLMAEMNDGSFWCIGYLKADVPDLPSWSKITCDERKVKIEN